MNNKICPICKEEMNFKQIHIIEEKSIVYYKCAYCCFVCWFEENNKFGLKDGVYRFNDLQENIKEKFTYKIIENELLGSRFNEIKHCPYCKGEVVLWKKIPFEYIYKEEIRERTDYLFVCKDCGTILYFGKFEKENEQLQNNVLREVKIKKTPVCPFCNNIIYEKYKKLNELLTSFKCNCGHIINRMIR